MWKGAAWEGASLAIKNSTLPDGVIAGGTWGRVCEKRTLCWMRRGEIWAQGRGQLKAVKGNAETRSARSSAERKSNETQRQRGRREGIRTRSSQRGKGAMRTVRGAGLKSGAYKGGGLSGR